jgi:hypothetical protein
MRSLVATVLSLFFIFAGSVLGADYEVTRVVDLGQGYSPTWSPDGTKLLILYQRSFYVVDTLGNREEIVELDRKPKRFAWLSDYEVIMHQFDVGKRPGPSIGKLSVIDINDKTTTVIKQFEDFVGVRNDVTYLGPLVSWERNAYYLTEVNGREVAVFPASKYKSARDQESPTRNHVLRAGDSALYRVNLDMSDSTRIGPIGRVPGNIRMSRDQKHYFSCGSLWTVGDSSRISMDTIARQYLEDDILGFNFCGGYFHPHDKEMLLSFDYDVSQYESHVRLATYDYVTNDFTILCDLLGFAECGGASYSPDGRVITLVSGGHAYLVYREVK